MQSLGCMSEANIILYVNYTPIKKYKIFKNYDIMPNTKFEEKHSKHLCSHHPALSSLDTETY